MSLGMMNPYQPSLAQMQAQSQAAIAAQQRALQGLMQLAQSAPSSGSVYWINSGTTSTATTSSIYTSIYNSATGGASTTTVASSVLGTVGLGGNGRLGWVPPVDADGDLHMFDGHAIKIKLPDGTVIDLKADGSFTIEDQNAQVTYRANRLRDFNTFLNASDRLEEFIAFCGEQGVSQDDMLSLPINLFIGWLIVEAARADKEPEPEVPLLEDLRKHVQGEPVEAKPVPAAVAAPQARESRDDEIAQLKARIDDLMNENAALGDECLQMDECRAYADKRLGTDSTVFGPCPHFVPFFRGVVNELVLARQELAQLALSQLHEIAA